MWEKMGATRISGKILGYLLVCDKELVSFQELVDELKVSKASVSTNLKVLEQIEFIQPVSISGDRKTYYRATPVNMVQIFERRLKLITVMLDIMKKGQKLKENRNDSASHFLTEAIDFYSWFEKNIPEFFKQYKQK
jgi:DNA-binding transcriptional regulator GbsR (MarR family)